MKIIWKSRIIVTWLQDSLLAVAVVTNMPSVSMLMGIDMHVVCIRPYSEREHGRQWLVRSNMSNVPAVSVCFACRSVSGCRGKRSNGKNVLDCDMLGMSPPVQKSLFCVF